MKHRPKFIAEYLLLRGVAALVNVLPYRAALSIGWAMAGLGMLVQRNRMRQFEGRLHAVLDEELTPRRARALLWGAWRNFCFSIIDILRTPSISEERARREFPQQAPDELRDYISDGRGAILALAHMGSWELAGAVIGRMGIPLSVVTRKQKNPLTDAYLTRMREEAGLFDLPVDRDFFRDAIRRLRRGEVVAILPDIRARAGAVTVDFLGGRASLPKGMALFARAADVPIIPVHIRRDGWVKHHWELCDAVYPDRSRGKDEDVQRMTQEVMTCLEQRIRRHPDQYFWFNKRWILGEEGSL